jgi:molybdopterin-guanine dinucleotide biosynthesis protein A
MRPQGTIAVASSGDRQHFTTALWSLALRDDLRAALVERDERRVGAYLARHGAIAVDWPADPVDPFLNLNTPEDLAAAEALLASRGA